jgi:plasmid stabilization system protein ParE
VDKRFAVEWTEVALSDLAELVDFIESEDPGAASAVLDKLERAVGRLELLPLRGRIVPELARFDIRLYRELIVRPWRILYRVGPKKVFVVAVLDGRRDLESLLLARLLRPE